MENLLIFNIYINKNKELFFIPLKSTNIGYRISVKPYKVYYNWNNIGANIITMIDEMFIDFKNRPIVEKDFKFEFWKEISKTKSFKAFSKEHICIEVVYDINKNEMIIYNFPRLKDGSYGIENDSVSEFYSKKYMCKKDKLLLENCFLKAFEDSMNYLKVIK